MDVQAARVFIQQNHRAVLGTLRANGVPQLSPVSAGLDDEGRVEISANEDKAKVLNLRRDPRATVCVMNDRFFGPWVTVEGTATIVSLPDALEPLVEYYRRLAGEHPDWDEYREAMVRYRRCLIRIDVERAYGR